MNVPEKTLYGKIRGFLGAGYKPSDDELIRLYCETFQFYERLRDELGGQDLMYEYTNKAGATNLTKNPLTVELTKVVQALNNLLKSLGLTPAQRKAFEAGERCDDEDI
jgi:P27 family predicted phage terminase small subunit